MKVYSCPVEVPAPEPDYSNYNREKEMAAEAAHIVALKAHLIAQGYTGKYTGEIARRQVADGYAQYMLADGGRGSHLVHLPYGDAYHARDIQYVPKAEIIREIEHAKGLAALFGRK